MYHILLEYFIKKSVKTDISLVTGSLSNHLGLEIFLRWNLIFV